MPLDTAETLPAIPEFEVLSLLGYGAQSTIYAVMEQKTRQLYALKHVLRRSPEDDRFIEQAERELDISSKFNHPGLRKSHRIIKRRKLLKVAELYLLMDFFDGTSLDTKRPPSIAGLVAIFLKVADALHAMHHMGFVHADIKPNNILASDKWDVKIIDFGQSCAIGTVKTRIQGTPDFIAPEQVHRDPLTPQTDMFNLGTTMYWCVTGQYIPTDLPHAAGMPTRSVGPVRPPHEINPQVPLPLSKLILDCIEHDSEHRPENMNVVRARLEMALPPHQHSTGNESHSSKLSMAAAGGQPHARTK
jgi:eukaryotic-like serine/threonine-protein kinase